VDQAVPTATVFQPTFLYPNSSQFPFDPVCREIVLALEARHWSVPGITIELDEYGRGEERYQLVRSIQGPQFRLYFGRPQARLGTYNDTAAISSITIPCRKINVYEDESGPTYIRYVGGNWPRDRQEFMTSGHINRKLYGKPRTYLSYTGGCGCQLAANAAFGADELWGSMLGNRSSRPGTAVRHTHPGRRSPLLVHDDDLGREYEPKHQREMAYDTATVMAMFTRYLERLLSKILAQPIGLPPATTRAVEPTMPQGLVSIFCLGEYEDADRIVRGEHDPWLLEPACRFGMQGSGYRLQPLGSGGSDIPRIAYKTFLWCGLGQVTSGDEPGNLVIPGQRRITNGGKYVLRVVPHHAGGIYVADHAHFEATREELFASIAPRERLTDAEVDLAYAARSRTIIPVTEYAGGFKEPVVLICRELRLAEVEVVSGPWPLCQTVTLIAGRSERSKTLLRAALALCALYHESYDDESRTAYHASLELLVRLCRRNKVLDQIQAGWSRLYDGKSVVERNFIGHVVDTAATMQLLGLLKI
jgi:hypothetical protein